jgi:hypothetical protein
MSYLAYKLMNERWVQLLRLGRLVYLFDRPADGWSISNLWVSFNCRRRNHPNGPIYFNPSGWEPDMSCQDCGDEL